MRRWMLLAGVLATAAMAAADDANAPNAAAPAGDANAPRARDRVHILPIHGQINKLTHDILERGVAEAQKAGADVMVFDIDTPGGLVSAAIDISRMIKGRTGRMHTVAWVNPEAISAGSLISLACDEIVVAPRSKIGDCAAIMVGPQGMQSLGETERAKIDSYILAEFRDSAKANDYPMALSESMVTLGPAVYRVRNTASGAVRYVYADNLPRYGLTEDDALRPAEGVSKKDVRQALDSNTPTEPNNPAEPNAPADAMAPGDPNAIGNNPEAWVIDKQVLEARSLLTMLGDEAIEYGFATTTVADQDELLAHLDATSAEVIRLDRTWSEVMVAYLTSPLIQGLLTIVLLMALYSEMQAPGLGFAGLVALLAGAVLLGAPYLAGLAQWWEILIILAGLGLIAIELLVIPGFGVAGIAGILCVFLGLMLAFVPNEIGPNVVPQLPGTWDALLNSLLSMAVSFTLAIIGMILLTRHVRSIPMLNRLMLNSGESTALADAPADIANATRVADVGDTGQALNDLRPAGRAQFGRRIVDVVTIGSWIEAGSTVRVTEVRGNRIVVEEA